MTRSEELLRLLREETLLHADELNADPTVGRVTVVVHYNTRTGRPREVTFTKDSRRDLSG